MAGGKNGTLAAGPAMLQTPARIAAWRDVVLAFWNDDGISAQQAADKMAAAAKANLASERPTLGAPGQAA